MSAGRPTDGGFSLVEVLIALVILGLGFTALLGAMGTAFSGANTFRGQSNAGTVVISAVERVKDAAYSSCATPSTYLTAAQEAAQTAGWPASAVKVDEVRYWNGFTYGSTCQEATSPYLAMQLITVSVTSPDSRAVERLQVAKRAS